MQYFAELLTAAFKAISREDAPKTLAIISGEGQDGDTGSFIYPSNALPANCIQRSLLGGEGFPEEAMTAVMGSLAKCAFVFPPFIGDLRLSTNWRDKFGRLGMTEAVARTLIGGADLIDDLGPPPQQSQLEVLALLSPINFISNFRCEHWRREFFPAHSALVIEHDHEDVPGAIGLPFNSGVRFSTVVFQRRPGPIRFFKITNSALETGVQKITADLERLLRQPAGRTQFGYVYSGPLEEKYPCSYDFYSEETERLRQEIGELGARVNLGSVADIFLGFRSCHPEREEGLGETGFQFINATAITKDGDVDLSDLQTQTRPARMVQYLQEGDFCIRRIYRPDSGFIVGIYEGDGRPVAFSSTVIVVRPKATLNPAQRQVLFTFLRSPLSHRLGNAKQVLSSLRDHLQVSSDVLRDYPVPLADEELVSAIQQLSEAKGALSGWIEEIDSESNAILEEATASGSRRRILRAGQLARQRHRAAKQVEELDYRIRTQFPHPLAYVWRELQVAGQDRYHRLRAVTKAAEGHTCFMALIAILISQRIGQPLAYVNEISKRLSQRKSGTNFGDWLSIIRELNAGRAFKAQQMNAPFNEVMQLCALNAWEPAITKLKSLRDDDSHGRIAPTNVSVEMLAEAEKSLEIVYRATEFLTDYQLLYLTETRFDSIRQINRFSYRDLTGDNPLAPLRNDQSVRADLESGSLYLRDRNGHLHLFRPLLHYLECPQCHVMSTFFLDTYNGSEGGEIVGLKSFERNSVRMEKVATDFRHVGLLPKEGKA